MAAAARGPTYGDSDAREAVEAVEATRLQSLTGPGHQPYRTLGIRFWATMGSPPSKSPGFLIQSVEQAMCTVRQTALGGKCGRNGGGRLKPSPPVQRKVGPASVSSAAQARDTVPKGTALEGARGVSLLVRPSQGVLSPSCCSPRSVSLPRSPRPTVTDLPAMNTEGRI